MPFDKTIFIDYCNKQNYISRELVEKLIPKIDFYLPLVTAIYLHPNPNIKKSISECLEESMPIFLKEMFLTHKEIILDILANNPKAIMTLLSFSYEESKKAYFAEPIVQYAIKAKFINYDDAFQFNVTQLKYLNELHPILNELYQAGFDVRSVIIHKFKYKLIANPKQISKIFNELINDEQHRASIFQKLLPLNLDYIADILKIDSINNQTIDGLVQEINRQKDSNVQAIANYVRVTGYRLTISELSDCFTNKLYLLMRFLSIDGHYYLDQIKTSSSNREILAQQYVNLWYQSIRYFITHSNQIIAINTDALDRILQLYHDVPDLISFILPLLFDKNNVDLMIKNLISLPVCYFLFDEHEGSPEDKFQQIIKLTSTQRKHFESLLIAKLLQNHLITVEQVLSLEKWQRNYLEVVSTKASYQVLQKAIAALPTLDKTTGEQFITDFFQQAYHLNKQELPYNQQKNISCLELRMFFKQNDIEQLLNCSSKHKKAIKMAYFHSLVAKQEGHKRILDFIQPLKEQQTNPIAKKITNYEKSSDDSVVKTTIANIHQKYNNYVVNIDSIYSEMISLLLYDFCKKQKSALLLRSKGILEKKETDNKMILSHTELAYFVADLLLKLMVLPSHSGLYSQIIETLKKIKCKENYNDYYSFLMDMVCVAFDIDLSSDCSEWILYVKEDYNLSDSLLINLEKIVHDCNQRLFKNNNVIIFNNTFKESSNYLNILFATLFFIDQDLSMISKKHGSNYSDELEHQAIYIPIDEPFKSFIVMKTILYLNIINPEINIQKLNKELFVYYWLELQERGAKTAISALEILTDTLLEIGTTYSLGDDKKTIQLMLKNYDAYINVTYGFSPPQSQGICDKLMEKLAAISSLANSNTVNPILIEQVKSPDIKKEIEIIVQSRVVHYLLAESMPKHQKTALKIWLAIKEPVIQDIIHLFGNDYPGISVLDDTASISSRKLSSQEQGNLALFSGYINEAWEAIIVEILKNPIEPPAKRHCQRLFQPAPMDNPPKDNDKIYPFK